MTKIKLEETVTLSRATFEHLLTTLELYLKDTHEGIATLEHYLREGNFEHDMRFRLTDILAGKKLVEKVIQRVRTEAKLS